MPMLLNSDWLLMTQWLSSPTNVLITLLAFVMAAGTVYSLVLGAVTFGSWLTLRSTSKFSRMDTEWSTELIQWMNGPMYLRVWHQSLIDDGWTEKSRHLGTGNTRITLKRRNTVLVLRVQRGSGRLLSFMMTTS